jgi:hypothetical protein
MRTCPVCERKFPHGDLKCRRKTARPIWTCNACYNREKRRNKRGERKPNPVPVRDPKAKTGSAGQCTPETYAKLRDNFRTNPHALQRICDLLEGNNRYATTGF